MLAMPAPQGAGIAVSGPSVPQAHLTVDGNGHPATARYYPLKTRYLFWLSCYFSKKSYICIPINPGLPGLDSVDL